MPPTTSASEDLRAGAASVTQTLANSVSPSTPGSLGKAKGVSRPPTQGESVAPGSACLKDDYKSQLNDAATGKGSKLGNGGSIFEKAAAYVPGMNTSAPRRSDDAKLVDDGTPPTRPENDTQVEEFLKNQYCSKKGDT